MVYPKEWFFFREAWKVRSNMANACDKDWWELSNILLVFIWNAGQKLILEIPEIYERKRFGQVDQKRHWINSNVTIYRYMYKNMKWMTLIGTHMNKKDRWMTQKSMSHKKRSYSLISVPINYSIWLCQSQSQGKKTKT